MSKTPRQSRLLRQLAAEVVSLARELGESLDDAALVLVGMTAGLVTLEQALAACKAVA